jgi:hypothetical protein
MEFKRVWKDAGMASFRVLYRNFPMRAEENHDKISVGIVRLQSDIQSRLLSNIKQKSHLIATFDSLFGRLISTSTTIHNCFRLKMKDILLSIQELLGSNLDPESNNLLTLLSFPIQSLG